VNGSLPAAPFCCTTKQNVDSPYRVVTGPGQTRPRPTLPYNAANLPTHPPATPTTDPVPILTSSLPPSRLHTLPYPRLPSSSPAQPPTRPDLTRLIISSHPKPNPTQTRNTSHNAHSRPRKLSSIQPNKPNPISSHLAPPAPKNTDHHHHLHRSPLSAHSLHVHVRIHVHTSTSASTSTLTYPYLVSTVAVYLCVSVSVSVSVFRHATPHHAAPRRASNTSGAEPRTRLWKVDSWARRQRIGVVR
jgi:hypothetical protein